MVYFYANEDFKSAFTIACMTEGPYRAFLSLVTCSESLHLVWTLGRRYVNPHSAPNGSAIIDLLPVLQLETHYRLRTGGWKCPNDLYGRLRQLGHLRLRRHGKLTWKTWSHTYTLPKIGHSARLISQDVQHSIPTSEHKLHARWTTDLRHQIIKYEVAKTWMNFFGNIFFW